MHWFDLNTFVSYICNELKKNRHLTLDCPTVGLPMPINQNGMEIFLFLKYIVKKKSSKWMTLDVSSNIYIVSQSLIKLAVKA